MGMFEPDFAAQPEAAACFEGTFGRADPPEAERSEPAPVGEVRERLGPLIGAWLDSDETHLMNVDLGVGKTTAVLDRLPSWLARNPGEQIVIAAPTHRLAEQLQQDLASRVAPGLVRVWRGLERQDPLRPGERMCPRHEEARGLRGLGLGVSALCRECPFAETCGAQRQRRARARVWVVPHALLFAEKPWAMDAMARLIIDEDVVGAALDERRALSADELRGAAGHESAVCLDQAGALLLETMTTSDDRIDIEALRQAGLDEAMADRARAAAETLAAPPDLDKTMGPAVIEDAVKRYGAGISRAHRLATFWRVIGEAMMAGCDTAPGIRLRRGAPGPQETHVNLVDFVVRREIDQSWRSAPTLLLDATAERERIEALLGPLDLMAELRADQPHVSVRSVSGRSFSDRSLCPRSAPTKDRDAAARLRSEIVDYVTRRAAAFAPGEVLVVGPQRLKEAIREDLPANVRTAHYNALRGVNDYERCRAVILIGRPLPSSRDAEMRAEALFRTPVGPGDYVEGPAYRHPDPRADRERRAICEAELAQAAGRGRGVNRTAETPLQIDLLCPYPIGLPADETVAWHAVSQDWLFECAARGLVPESGRAYNEVLSRILPRFASAAKVASARTYLRKKCGFEMPVVVGPVAPAHLDHAFGVSSWPRITVKIGATTASGRRYAGALRVDPARGCPAAFARSILGRDCEVTRDGAK